MLRLVMLSLLLLGLAAAVAPSAAADPPSACVAKYCEGNYAVVVDAFGQHVDACVIGVHGSCDPYSGHLVRAHVNDEEHTVPDPCYTTSCV